MATRALCISVQTVDPVMQENTLMTSSLLLVLALASDV